MCIWPRCCIYRTRFYSADTVASCGPMCRCRKSQRGKAVPYACCLTWPAERKDTALAPLCIICKHSLHSGRSSWCYDTTGRARPVRKIPCHRHWASLRMNTPLLPPPRGPPPPRGRKNDQNPPDGGGPCSSSVGGGPSLSGLSAIVWPG